MNHILLTVDHSDFQRDLLLTVLLLLRFRIDELVEIDLHQILGLVFLWKHFVFRFKKLCVMLHLSLEFRF